MSIANSDRFNTCSTSTSTNTIASTIQSSSSSLLTNNSNSISTTTTTTTNSSEFTIFEFIYGHYKEKIKRREDSIVLFIHYYLVTNRFKCFYDGQVSVKQ